MPKNTQKATPEDNQFWGVSQSATVLSSLANLYSTIAQWTGQSHPVAEQDCPSGLDRSAPLARRQGSWGQPLNQHTLLT